MDSRDAVCDNGGRAGGRLRQFRSSADTALQSSAVGESGGSSSAGDDGTAGGDYTAADSGSDATTQADGSGNIDWDEDPALVNWYMWGVGVSAPSTEALDRVEEKINAITEPAINVTVNLENAGNGKLSDTDAHADYCRG